MNKQTIEISVPDGYEVAEGEQPRAPKTGDYYWQFDWSVPSHSKVDRTAIQYIILKKKAPEYEIKYINAMDGTTKLVKYVEIKALEDALEIIENMDMYPDLDVFECDAYGPLKELLK